MTKVSVAEVPAIIVIELECGFGPGGDLTHANKHALGLARLEMCRDVTERPVLVIRPPVLIIRDRVQQM